jgi:phenylpropionate dioxygenase-like ring-hydroxylating dioxygenase large terminal subunit
MRNDNAGVRTDPDDDPRRPTAGRMDWSAWPTYQAAAEGLPNYWYPVEWSSQIDEKPRAFTVAGQRLVLVRDAGSVFALDDRCPHRGVPLSLGSREFPGTLSCRYHGWTYSLEDGVLQAAITDGPDSPICGKVAVRTFPLAERLGLVWVYIGEGHPHAIDDQLPEELVGTARFAIGGRIRIRSGNWRFAAENGFDEGHAKFLHRKALWRWFKTMPTWNTTRIERRGRWIYRAQDAVYWEADFPGLGVWTNKRWWKQRPPEDQPFNLGNTGAAKRADPYIAGQAWPGFASLSLPGVLRIAYPQFVHYEFYVPVDADKHRYVGLMVQFKKGAQGRWFHLRYLIGIRWLFHGQFSNQDARMVEKMDCPPERLYRPDLSMIAWRRLCEEPHPFQTAVEPPAMASEPASSATAASRR